MKKERIFKFSKNKDKKLLSERGVSFDQVIFELNANRELDIVEHHNIQKYSYQKIFIIGIKNYIYAVPFVQKKNYFFLKTIFPSRKLTKKYLFKTKR